MNKNKTYAESQSNSSIVFYPKDGRKHTSMMINSKCVNTVIFMMSLCIITLSIVSLIIFSILIPTIKNIESSIEYSCEPKVIYRYYGGQNLINTSIKDEENCAAELISSIGTNNEVDMFGYSFSYVARVVMAESGANSKDLQLGVCQAILNRSKRTNTTPEEAARNSCTNPVKFDSVTDEVWDSCYQIFVYGNTYSKVKDADMFYNPDINGQNERHECQEYICTIDNVRFFTEK